MSIKKHVNECIIGVKGRGYLGQKHPCIAAETTGGGGRDSTITAVMPAADLLFRQLFDSTSSTFTYILADLPTREAVIIDPVIEQVQFRRVLHPSAQHKYLYLAAYRADSSSDALAADF